MKITKAEIVGIHLPLKEPFIISYVTYDFMPSIIVKLETDDGLVGYGEAVPDENVTGETFFSVIEVLKHQLLPAIMGESPFSIEKIHDMMDSRIHANSSAKAAIDIACYDLMGKYTNKPIYELIGGKYHNELTFAKVLSIEEPEIMAHKAKEALALGYSSLKLKVGFDLFKDLERIKAVRQAVGYEVPIRVDVNQGWKNYSTAAQALPLLEPLRISWLEQPIKMGDINGLAELRKKTIIPIMADESVHNTFELLEIIKKNAADKINIKLMKSAGIYPALHMAKIAEYAGLSCQVGSMVESSIGSAAGYHTAMARKNITSTELTGPLLFSKDIGNLEYRIPNVILSGKPGLGVEVNEDTLQELTIKKETVQL
ncbi:mandelate racemase [Heyndrickxia shackletonii]|uniref:Dipeptide epimerase n=1 Tax=Heyndrickxia shackletonii TaxID=157838 RepID=A0A0Q3WYT1_9BACI|nr:dipeptide epimerase [Heyndrickxia shackletonii]KQL54221.1 mandelate racemase [Heyndrickxia shackletonii]NEZ00900.1 dipeptide epimerase [Heyndrickxia shackletonii]